MRYLGLDLGTKTVGVALSDKTNTIATKLKTIHYDETSYDKMLEEIVNLIKEYEITCVVLGLPKNMDNSLGFASNRSLEFQKKLQEIINIPIELVDERLTTVQAENILLTADISRKKRKKVIDGVAATIILDTYLRMKGNKDERK